MCALLGGVLCVAVESNVGSVVGVGVVGGSGGDGEGVSQCCMGKKGRGDGLLCCVCSGRSDFVPYVVL